MRIKNFFSLAKGFVIVLVISFTLTLLLQLTYSYVPHFLTYFLSLFLNEPLKESGLPKFIYAFLESLNGDLPKQVLSIAITLVIWQLMRYTFLFFENITRGFVQEGISKNLKNRLYGHIQDLSFSYHNNVDTGDLIQRVTSDVEASSGFLSSGIGQVVYIISTMIFGAIQLSRISVLMMVIALLVIPFVALSSIIYFKKIDKLNEHIEKTESKMTVVIQENLQASKVVKSFGNEAHEVQVLDEKSVSYRDSILKENKISAFYWGFMDFFGLAEYLVITMVGIFGMMNNTIEPINLIAAFGLLGMLIWPMRSLGRIIKQFSKSLVASDRIHEIFQKEIEFKENETNIFDIKGKIEFQNVTFKFDDAEEALLKGVSFEINPGETVAFVGKTGSGKSTIVNLLLRMYDCNSGVIKIDGVELQQIEKHFLRSNIGSVLQEPFLYSKTVYQNIAIANKSAKEEEIYRAAEVAALAKDIHTFKNGYETMVGEKGTTLSGGQKQRVAIARILVSDKPILIFDDALSALDNKTDLLIRKALKEKKNKATNIIITHRITTAKEADKIIVLNEGNVDAIGSHDELKEKPGLYQNLWNIQGKLESEFLKMIEGD